MLTRSRKRNRDDPFRNSDATIRKILTEVDTIALVGASDKEDRPSNEVMKILLVDCGFNVIPINPRLKGQLLMGQRVLGSLQELSEAKSTTKNLDASNQFDKTGTSSQRIGGRIMVDIFRKP